MRILVTVLTIILFKIYTESEIPVMNMFFYAQLTSNSSLEKAA